MPARELKPEELRALCDASKFSFQTTEELPALTGFVNQERAIQGLELGISSTDKSFHIACILAGGKSRTSALVEEIRRIAKENLNPDDVKDWVYVFNFDNPKKPALFSLLAGHAKKFSKAMKRFEEEFGRVFPEEINSKENCSKRISLHEKIYAELVRPFNARFAARKVEGIYFQFEWDVQKNWNPHDGNPIALPRFEEEENGTVSIDIKGRVDYIAGRTSRLSPEKREEYDAMERDFTGEIPGFFRSVSERFFEETLEADKLFTAEIFDRYADKAGLGDYSAECWQKHIIPLREFVAENFRFFLPQGQAGPFGSNQADMSVFFEVNVAVDNGELEESVPVIYEDEPTFRRLFGNAGDAPLRHGQGESSVDHRDLTCGSMHKANGGVLVIPLSSLLKDLTPLLTWETLCRALRNKKLAPQGLGDYIYSSFVASSPLKPEEMSISTRVVLLVERDLDFIFSANPFLNDGYGLFRSRAEFVRDVVRDDASEMEMAKFLGNCARKEALLHCDTEAVALFVEHSSRLANDQKKISLEGFSKVKGLFLQAVYWARKRDSNAKVVLKEDVKRALEEMVYRSNVLDEHLKELIKDGILKVSVEGEVAEVVNGLAVLSWPYGHFFGNPSRVSATTIPGSGHIVNVEGKVRLGGKIYNKSIFIAKSVLAGLLRPAPLSYEASVVFEQGYSRVDGDSASCVEIYAILSSLACLPVKQSVAVTGSCNQLGEVQAIGGVNEKIEGFFGVCKAKSALTGEQAVVIPADNVRHLMLNEEVVRAVKNGLFKVWAIDKVEDGLAILTGLPAEEVKKRARNKLRSFQKEKRKNGEEKSDNGVRDEDEKEDD